MRMLWRALVGWGLALGAAGLLALAVLELNGAGEDDAATRAAPAEERVHTVSAAILHAVTARPEITAHGVVRSLRTAQIAPAVGGRVAFVAGDWRDGGRIAAGADVLRIDTADFAADVEDARIALAESDAAAAEARQSVRSAEVELDAARTQRDLRAATLERQTALARRGVSSTAVVEEAGMALAATDQALASREQALLTAQLRIGRSDLAVRRARLTLEQAERRLAETVVRAPFAGLVADTAVAVGAQVAAGQIIGALIDPQALEAALRVSGDEFGRLLDPSGALRPAAVTVTLDLGERSVTVRGALDRVDATVTPGDSGRTVFARLDADPGTVLRPGDFVSARIAEPPLPDVAVVPAAAIAEDGTLLVIGEGDRLVEVVARILRRDGDDVIISGAPFGSLYVSARAPQLGPGLKVRPVGVGAEVSAAPDPRG